MTIDLISRLRRIAAELGDLAGQAEALPIRSSDDDTARAEELVTRFLDRLDAGDLGGIDELVHLDAAYTIPGRSRISGVYEGADGIRAACAIVPRPGVSDLRTKLTDLIAEEGLVVTFHELSGTADGRPVAFELALRFRVRDGRIASIAEYSADQYASDGLFTEPSRGAR